MSLSINTKKVIIGMSGGVDSSVSAWILKQKGYKVEGLFMKNWENDDNQKYCAAKSDLSDAYSVCNTLKINLHTINFSKEYWDKVFTIFLQEYNLGRTPNPDVLCNKEIKFKYFLRFALKNLKADFIATGHYAQVMMINNKMVLMRGADVNKDQSYFLHTLNHQQLKYCLFPLGKLQKSQVRNIAKKLNLVTANKKDSTGICFIGKRKFKNFLSQYIPIKPGDIVNTNGIKIGVHQGIMFYTIGQRKGLNIGGIKNGTGKPWYVVEKNVSKNILIAAQGNDNPYLMSTEFIVEKVNWIKDDIISHSPFCCSVKTRYRQSDVECHVYIISKKSIRIISKKPIVAVAPGQSAVFYYKQHCLGGGPILKRFTLIPINLYNRNIHQMYNIQSN